MSSGETSRKIRKPLQWLMLGGVIIAVLGILLIGRERTTLPENLSDSTIVATLGSATSPLPQELRYAVWRARGSPKDRAAAVDAAKRYLDYGREVGDARFVGAALGTLVPWLETSPDAEILNLAASGRQYMHDFAGALELLDRVLVADPRNAQALLSRANIRVVQGQFGPAAEDCRGLARARRPDLAILCDTTVKALTIEAPMAFDRLDRMVKSKAIDPALVGYANSLLAEIARFNGDPATARAKFELALAASPDDLRTLMIMVDLDLAEGRAMLALERLAKAPVTDGIMVRQVEAYLAVGDTDAAERIGGILRARFAEAAAAGDTAHSREVARYWLAMKDKEQALTAASANWDNQRELEDALLLMAAAKAAGKADAASPVLDWAAAEKVSAPRYLEALHPAAARDLKEGQP